MGNGRENTVSETTREVYERCCEPGAQVRYRTLRLEKLAHTDGHGRWQIKRDGEYVDTINTDAFRSASELQRWLDAAVDGEDLPLGSDFESRVQATPGD